MNKWLPTDRAKESGFTLLELMIVIGIAAVLMTTAVPFVGGLMNERPLVQTTNDLMEALGHARAQAILHSKVAVLQIRPLERTFRALAAGAGGSTDAADKDIQFLSNEASTTSSEAGGVFTATIHEDVTVTLMDVNFISILEEPVAEVHFYPNGTCDMFAVVLEMEGQFRMIQLDMITGIAEFETDPEKFEQR